MSDELSIPEFLVAISRLPEDRRIKSEQVWYESRKEH